MSVNLSLILQWFLKNKRVLNCKHLVFIIYQRRWWWAGGPRSNYFLNDVKMRVLKCKIVCSLRLAKAKCISHIMISCEAQITNFHAIELHCNALHLTSIKKSGGFIWSTPKTLLSSFWAFRGRALNNVVGVVVAEYHLGLSFSTHENSLSAVVTNKTLELKHGVRFLSMHSLRGEAPKEGPWQLVG